MMKPTRAAAAAVLSLFLAGPAAAQQIFFGESTTGSNTTRASLVPGQTAEATFLSQLTGVGTETFDNQTLGATGPLALNFGVAGTATLTGQTCVSNWTWSACTNQVLGPGASASGTNGYGRYSVYTAPNGGKYWEAVSGGFSITFSNPIAAFGFWGIDVGDFSTGLSLAFLNGGTTVRTVSNFHTIGSQANGAAFFWGIIDTANQFDEIQFNGAGAGGDVFAFDNMTIGTQQQVIPEPSTYILLATGLLGVAILARRRGGWEEVFRGDEKA